MFDNAYFIIPARKGSKGFPGKNRELFKHTASSICSKKNRVFVTSDDFNIIIEARKAGFIGINRRSSLSKDEVAIKPVIQDVISSQDGYIVPSSDIILLYLTYPERTIEDIEKIYSFYKQNNLKSLITAIKPDSHPYLCYEKKNGIYKSVIKHKLHRRQQYPECREICHFMCIFKSSIIKKLDNRLIFNKTWFYDIKKPIDVDSEEDYYKFLYGEKK